ncbi:MAG: hypothetical protein ACI4UE_01635 [Candidatus Scatovivens sp.]
MNYFDSKITIEIVSLDDVNIQKELERKSYEKYLSDESIDRNYCKKQKKKHSKKNGGGFYE